MVSPSYIAVAGRHPLKQGLKHVVRLPIHPEQPRGRRAASTKTRIETVTEQPHDRPFREEGRRAASTKTRIETISGGTGGSVASKSQGGIH